MDPGTAVGDADADVCLALLGSSIELGRSDRSVRGLRVFEDVPHHLGHRILDSLRLLGRSIEM
jgi:hypothetical protein